MRRRCIQLKSDALRKFPPRCHYLIAVSGGRDSVSLLHWLVQLGYRKLIVCHLNHQLRGQSSRADARFVEKVAAEYQADFEIGLANVQALAKKQRISIETAAREARYAFFAETARRSEEHTSELQSHVNL